MERASLPQPGRCSYSEGVKTQISTIPLLPLYTAVLMSTIKSLLAAGLTLATCVACPEPYTYSMPEQLNDDLPVGALWDVGIQPEPIETLMNDIRGGRYTRVDSILIIRDGRLVFEEYLNGWNRIRTHYIASCTKSVTSAVFGLAWDMGHITDLDESVFDSFPEYLALGDPLKDQIRLRHLLTMTAGFEWDQTPPNHKDLVAMLNSSDWIAYVLSRPMAAAPGERWNYCGGCTQLAAAVVERATGQHCSRLADRHLFGPMGITDYEWRSHDSGLVNADHGLYMRSRDMAKLGLLYLNRGRWQGMQLISEDWVEVSTQEQVNVSQNQGYGYQWWVMRERGIPYFMARGNGGQRIQVFPKLDMVAVFTQHYYDMGDPSERLLEAILSAVEP
jgi:CubicO group peptidase (beta-lactamase class C family)